VPMDLEVLRQQRDTLKETLRGIEASQRKLDGELKQLRQREIRTKREIEALTTLIELNDEGVGEDKKPQESASASP